MATAAGSKKASRIANRHQLICPQVVCFDDTVVVARCSRVEDFDLVVGSEVRQQLEIRGSGQGIQRPTWCVAT
jgi:hypothetical protein